MIWALIRHLRYDRPLAGPTFVFFSHNLRTVAPVTRESTGYDTATTGRTQIAAEGVGSLVPEGNPGVVAQWPAVEGFYRYFQLGSSGS